jgi:hypothetical protein
VCSSDLWQLWRTVFTEDAEIDYTSTPHGQKGSREQIAVWLEQSLALLDTTLHYITNIEIDINGDTARVRAMFHNPMQMRGVDGLSACGGLYHHHLVRSADGWRSTNLVEECIWFDNNPFS